MAFLRRTAFGKYEPQEMPFCAYRKRKRGHAQGGIRVWWSASCLRTMLKELCLFSLEKRR